FRCVARHRRGASRRWSRRPPSASPVRSCVPAAPSSLFRSSAFRSTQRLTSLESSDTTLPAQAGDDWRLLALVRRIHPGLHGTQQPLDRVERLAAFLPHALRVEVPRVARLEELPELPDHMPEPAGELDVGE